MMQNGNAPMKHTSSEMATIDQSIDSFMEQGHHQFALRKNKWINYTLKRPKKRMGWCQ